MGKGRKATSVLIAFLESQPNPDSFLYLLLELDGLSGAD